jgi:hypothetical protein
MRHAAASTAHALRTVKRCKQRASGHFYRRAKQRILVGRRVKTQNRHQDILLSCFTLSETAISLKTTPSLTLLPCLFRVASRRDVRDQ